MEGLRRRRLIELGLGLAASPLLPAARAAEAAGPALGRGVNLTHWFEYEHTLSVSPAELAALRRAGFDHVRIPFDPVVFGWQPLPEAAPLVPPALRPAVDAALQAGLDVVIDLHLAGEAKQAIEDEPRREAALLNQWQALARSLADTPSGRVAFELFNEPQYYGFASLRWPRLQKRLLAAVRAIVPQHLLLLTGAKGSSPDALAALDPVADPRLAYVFHFYLPYLFTHQGAEWMDARYTTAGLQHDIRYPSSAQVGLTPRLSRPHPSAAPELAQYLQDDWRAERIAEAMRPAFDWAKENHARVVCNEFGVIRPGVQPASRYRWVADVRRTLEAQGIGWAIWDYADVFGIAAASTEPESALARQVDPLALSALGLVAP